MNWLSRLFGPKWNTNIIDSPPRGLFLARVPSSKNKVQVAKWHPALMVGSHDYNLVNGHGNAIKADAWMRLPKP